MNKKITTKAAIAIVLLANLVSQGVLVAYADGNLVTPKPDLLPGPLQSTQESAAGVRTWFANKILPAWTQGIVGFVAMIAFAMLIYSGIRYLTAYGNEEAAQSAKKVIIYSLVGLLLALFSYTIVSIIVNIDLSTS